MLIISLSKISTMGISLSMQLGIKHWTQFSRKLKNYPISLMKIFCWKVRGAGHTGIIQQVCELINAYQANIIFLMEIKLSSNKEILFKSLVSVSRSLWKSLQQVSRVVFGSYGETILISSFIFQIRIVDLSTDALIMQKVILIGQLPLFIVICITICKKSYENSSRITRIRILNHG